MSGLRHGFNQCDGLNLMVQGATPRCMEFGVDRLETSSAAASQPGAGEVFRETPEGALANTATYSGAKGVLTRAD